MSDTPVTAGDRPDFEWMIVEIFGHRRHAGRAREEERFGAKMLRIDIPEVERVELANEDKPVRVLTATTWTTHFYGGSAIFSITMTDETTVLRMNAPYEAPTRFALSAPDDESSEEVVF